MKTNSYAKAPIPAHVPPELVVDFDFWQLKNDTDDPFEHFTQLLVDGIPRIFWTPRNSGHWVFCRHEDIVVGLGDWERFSSSPGGIPARVGGPAQMIPVELDPPEHQRVRAVLAPKFSPAAIQAMKSDIRKRAADLIDRFAALGHCDFMTDFAGHLPTGIFLDLMGLPQQQLPQFMLWEEMAMRGTDQKRKELGYDLIYRYLNDFIVRKRENLGEDDIAGTLLRYRDREGHPFSHDEVVACCNLLYMAGLDTVMNTLGFIFRYLSSNAGARQIILRHPEQLQAIVEEFTRVFGVPAQTRRVREDMAFRDIEMKSGDPVLLPTMLANRDDAIYLKSDVLDFSREPKKVLTFGAGPHRCLGVHLAKIELAIAIEEWFKRIPEFTLDPSEEITYVTGHTLGIHNLPLRWDA